MPRFPHLSLATGCDIGHRSGQVSVFRRRVLISSDAGGARMEQSCWCKTQRQPAGPPHLKSFEHVRWFHLAKVTSLEPGLDTLHGFAAVSAEFQEVVEVRLVCGDQFIGSHV